MSANCKNCGSVINENFCPNCGQKKSVSRITWSFIFKEILHFFTHVEKGFIGSTIRMWANPGAFTKSYIDGQRKNKQPPVSFLVVWAAIFVLVRKMMIFLFDYKMEILSTPSFVNREAATYYLNHVTYLTIVFIPVWTSISFFVGAMFKRINFAEAIVICFYSYGIFFLLLSLVTLICGLIFRINILSDTFNNIYTACAIINGVWLNYSLLTQFQIRFRLIRSLAIIIIGTVLMIKFIELIALNLRP